MFNQTEILRFRHPLKEDIVTIVAMDVIAVAFLATIISYDQHKHHPAPLCWLVFLFILVIYTILLVVFIRLQRVEIDTKNQTVSFANAGTYQLWKTFSLRDVVSMRATKKLKGRRGINIGLTTRSGRTRENVYLDNLDGPLHPHPIDSALFVALVQQLRHAHPDLRIAGMPPNYDGSLPRDICLFDGTL